MALIQIACSECRHRGFTAALPRVLHCHVCGHTALFHAGEYIIRGNPDLEPKRDRPVKRVLVPGEQRHRRKTANVAA
jgi:hypothetical protein